MGKEKAEASKSRTGGCGRRIRQSQRALLKSLSYVSHNQIIKRRKKNSPSYKIVVSNTRDKREGNFLDILGFYNPQTPIQMSLDKKKLNEWRSKGAIVTKAVELIAEGKYSYVKYSPKGSKKKLKKKPK